jgi:hypothetical protein
VANKSCLFCRLSMSKLTGFIHLAVAEILNFDSLGNLKFCGGRMHGSHAHTLRKTGSTFIWGSYRTQHGGGGFKSLVANDNKHFKILPFRTY